MDWIGKWMEGDQLSAGEADSWTNKWSEKWIDERILKMEQEMQPSYTYSSWCSVLKLIEHLNKIPKPLLV